MLIVLIYGYRSYRNDGIQDVISLYWKEIGRMRRKIDTVESELNSYL